MTRWMLSKGFRDGNNIWVPVCSAYAMTWICPNNPPTDDGWALISVACAPPQLEAAKQDPGVVVCPLLFDPAPITAQVVAAYAAKGATASMSIGALIALLAETEPLYATQ